MIDCILANPAVSQNEVAKMFGRTPAWISRVFCSDAFQARLAERKGDLVDPTLLASIEERLKGMVMQATDVIADKLDASRSPDLAVKALEIGGRLLGYGARKENVQLQQNFIAVVPSKAGSSAEWIEAHAPHRVAEVVEARPAAVTVAALRDLPST
jgi:hypothetical protein